MLVPLGGSIEPPGVSATIDFQPGSAALQLLQASGGRRTYTELGRLEVVTTLTLGGAFGPGLGPTLFDWIAEWFGTGGGREYGLGRPAQRVTVHIPGSPPVEFQGGIPREVNYFNPLTQTRLPDFVLEVWDGASLRP
jgi:hypothetical protein